MHIAEQARYYRALAERRQEALQEIWDYIHSAKFDKDNKCNVGDISMRLSESGRDIAREFDL